MANESKLLSMVQIVEGFPAVDLSTGANNGDWVSLENYKRVLIVFRSGVGTAGDDPTLTVRQATDAAGTSDKNLTFATIYRKQAATSLASTGQWTKTTQTAAATYTNTDAAEQSLIWCVDIMASDLDVANGFKFLRATVADVGGAAQPGDLLYLLYEPRYPDAPENMLSALA